MDLKTLVELCDLDLRQGHGHLVASRLAGLNLAAVPREGRLPLAKICRRANLFSMGLRLLTPLIYRERNKWLSEAAPEERSEYAALLSKNGNNSEALRILREIPFHAAPEAALYTAFCHMARWDYESSEAELKKYLTGGPDPYSELIANVNLGAGYVALGDWEKARDTLDANVAIARARKFHRLLANCLELRGQMHLRRGKWREAREDLNRAGELLGSDGTSDRLFVDKWKAILKGFADGTDESILAFRREAERKGHWESVRDADRFALALNFDEPRFHHLLFGTPFAGYRARLCRELGREPRLSLYRFGAEDGFSWNLLTGEFSDSTPAPAGVLRLISILTLDFYRPIKLGALFADLFPNDHFDVYSSPNRLHQALWRARRWLAGKNLALEFREAAGNYKLRVGEGFALLVPLERPSPSKHWLEQVRARFGGDEFTAKEVCDALSISRSNFRRKAHESLERGEILTRFAGSGVRYRLAA